MKRWLKQGLSLITLKKAIGFGNFYAATKFDLHLKEEKLDYKNALVLSPHPDDDCFALGGTIKKLTTAGTKVTVVYFCDGSGGVPEGRQPEEELGFSPKRDESLIARRKSESEKAAKILGINESVFWGYPDGKLASGTSVIRALQDLLERVQPDIIFLPSFLDNHSDHRVTNEIFINACLAGRKTASKIIDIEKIPIWAYEIWTPIFVNRLVDISLYIKTKQEAILAHQSQLETRGYDKAIIGLNQYRAEINRISGFAEAFFATPFEIYRELYRKS